MIPDPDKGSVQENRCECSGSICKSRAFVHGLEEPGSMLGCAGSSLYLPESAGLFPREMQPPSVLITSASQVCCERRSSYCSLYHLGRKWFPLVPLWWDAVVAWHNGCCTAMDLSKDVSAWLKAMYRTRGGKCAGWIASFSIGYRNYMKAPLSKADTDSCIIWWNCLELDVECLKLFDFSGNQTIISPSLASTVDQMIASKWTQVIK